MDYWDKSRDHWLKAVDAAEGAELGSERAAPATMRSAWNLFRSETPVAVTGLRGGGKSMLYDSLQGKVNLVDYPVRGRSKDVESHKSIIRMNDDKARVRAVVIPGQESEQRNIAVDRYFSESRFPAGVIHVVCWGYNRIWEASERRTVRRDLAARQGPVDLDGILDWNRDKELEDFRDTCALLIDTWGGNNRPVGWLIIAVAKADLYWQQQDTACDYYIPHDHVPSDAEAPKESEFCGELRKLVNSLGATRLRLAVVPVSCYPERYLFESGISQPTSGGPVLVNALVNNFRGLVGEFCGPQRRV
jgi:hypothetical protein